MPVDPGNLLLLARLGDAPVLGLPGCCPLAQAQRLRLGAAAACRRHRGRAARHHAHGRRRPARPRSRPARSRAKVSRADEARRGSAALVLAAGQSRRMGRYNKLLALVDGKPMVRHVVDAALASKADPVIVVTGHEPGQGRARDRQAQGALRAQSGLCPGPLDLAQGGARGAAGRRRGRAGAASATCRWSSASRSTG